MTYPKKMRCKTFSRFQFLVDFLILVVEYLNNCLGHYDTLLQTIINQKIKKKCKIKKIFLEKKNMMVAKF